MITIRRYTSIDKPLWDGFVALSKNATFLHYRDYMDYHSDRFHDFSLMAFDGGRLLAGMANAMSFIVDGKEERIAYPLPCNPLRYPEQMATFGEDDGIQFSHSYEENIQGMIDSGFAIRGIYSDTNRSGRLKEMGIPSFYAILAEK